MSTQHVGVLPAIKSWLSANHKKIESFWIGADWRAWARFELFMTLEKAFENDCLVTHSNDDFWTNSIDLVDIILEPREGDLGPVALVLRCEKVNENEGSFERFAEQFNEDWKRLHENGDIQSDFQGTCVLLLGFSGEAMGDGIENFTSDARPETFRSGEVNAWVKLYNVSK